MQFPTENDSPRPWIVDAEPDSRDDNTKQQLETVRRPVDATSAYDDGDYAEQKYHEVNNAANLVEQRSTARISPEDQTVQAGQDVDEVDERWNFEDAEKLPVGNPETDVVDDTQQHQNHPKQERKRLLLITEPDQIRRLCQAAMLFRNSGDSKSVPPNSQRNTL